MNIPPKSLKQRIALTGAAAPVSGESTSSPDRAELLLNSSGAYNKSRYSTPTLRPSSDLADMADVSADSLPVLQAFQEFIEAERRHARRQVMVVTSFFLMLFILVAGAGAFFGFVFFTQMNTEMQILRSELASASTSVRKDTAEMISSLAKRTESISDNIIDSDDLVKKASLEISNTFSNAIAARQIELDQIRRALKAIQLENQDLRKEVTSFASTDPAVLTAKAMADSGNKQPSAKPAATETAGQDNRAAPKRPEGEVHPIEIAILAPGANEPIKWRIPISE